MKLLIPKQSQRDSRWANIILGYNIAPPYTIGNYGCLISCFSMYLSALGEIENPATVNETLRANRGFQADSGNLIWGAIPRCYGLADVYQSPVYTGPVTDQGLTKMRSFLDAGQPLVTHVDFNPADSDDDMHWVLVMGYDDNDIFYANDPWSGNEISLDVYGGVKRAVIQFRAYDKPVQFLDAENDLQTALDKVRFERDNHWNTIVAVSNTLSVSPNEEIMVGEIRKLQGYEDVIRSQKVDIDAKSQEITGLQSQLTLLTEDLNKIKLENTKAQEKNKEQAIQIEEQKGQLFMQEKNMILLGGRIEELKKELTEVLMKALNGRTGLQIIWLGIKKIFGGDIYDVRR